jgi:hypothetical protein
MTSVVILPQVPRSSGDRGIDLCRFMTIDPGAHILMAVADVPADPDALGAVALGPPVVQRLDRDAQNRATSWTVHIRTTAGQLNGNPERARGNEALAPTTQRGWRNSGTTWRPLIRSVRHSSAKLDSSPHVEDRRAAMIDTRSAWTRPSRAMVGTRRQWRMAFGTKGSQVRSCPRHVARVSGPCTSGNRLDTLSRPVGGLGRS